jgi:hypothetical protein
VATLILVFFFCFFCVFAFVLVSGFIFVFAFALRRFAFEIFGIPESPLHSFKSLPFARMSETARSLISTGTH